MNELQKMLLKYPNKSWDWYRIYQNPNWSLKFQKSNITWEFIDINDRKFIDINDRWDRKQISRNPNITPEIIDNNPEFNWDWFYISMNPNITLEFIDNNIDKDWNWSLISQNPSITMDIIENNPDKPWVWLSLFRNPNITLEFIERHCKLKWWQFWKKRTPWEILSYNKFEYAFYELKNTEFGKRRRKQKIKTFKSSLPIIEDIENLILEYLIEY